MIRRSLLNVCTSIAATSLLGLIFQTSYAGTPQPQIISQMTATAFLNTLGVCTHMAYTDGLYANVAQVRADLIYLGINHVRDGISNGVNGSGSLSEYEQMAAGGVVFTFIIGGGGANTTSTLNSTLSLMQTVVQQSPGSISVIEGPNEINNQPLTWNGSSDATGPDNLASAEAEQQALYSAVKGNSAFNGVKVAMFTGADAGNVPVGPNPATTPGYADLNTQHPYPNNGEAPAYWVSPNVAGVNDADTSGPMIYTETGYTSNGGTSGGLNQDANSKWGLDLYFDTASYGIYQTDWYELLDAYAPGSNQGDNYYGYFDYTGAPKPLAVGMHNLTTILNDPGTGVPNLSAASSYSVSNLPSTGKSLLLTRTDGSSNIVLWAEPSIWTESSGSENTVAPTQALVSLGATYQTVEIFDPLRGSVPITIMQNVNSITVPVSDHPVILWVGAALTSASVAATGSSGNGPSYLAVNPQPGNYTLAATDTSKLIESTSTVSVTFTVPTPQSLGFPSGTVVDEVQGGAGQILFSAGPGATIVNNGGNSHSSGQFAVTRLIATSATGWLLSGSTAQ